MSVLRKILESKRREIEELHRQMPQAPLVHTPLPVSDALRRVTYDPLRLIGEIKFRSPSAGPLSQSLTVTERALAYARGGLAMLSVLCDEPFFGGGYGDVAKARQALTEGGFHLPILAKEFVLDPIQMEMARQHGADAVLVIVRVCGNAEVARLVEAARACNLEPVVEVIDESELEAALGAGAQILGVNARDLDTLEMDLARASRVLAAIPAGVTALHLSGLKTPADVAAIRTSRADGALIGEALMRKDDPSELLRALTLAAAS